MRLQVAAGWVDGLAANLILPWDVNRLAGEHPRMTRAIRAAWSDLSSLERRPAGGNGPRVIASHMP